MSERLLRIVSIVLGLVSYYALQNGHFLIGGAALAANGLLMLATPRKPWARALGAAIMLFGLYIVAAALGLLAYAALAALPHSLAFAIGGGLILGGILIMRSMRPTVGSSTFKIACGLVGGGAVLVAYGLGYFG
ncbi:MAG: hypothetical protein QY323_02000 [Patescibacteria group bacterium]|nr:MAG: hypothetical protein QY323_02000 [Patescibacteria group bacterium]